jgi:hypothetical protein
MIEQSILHAVVQCKYCNGSIPLEKVLLLIIGRSEKKIIKRTKASEQRTRDGYIFSRELFFYWNSRSMKIICHGTAALAELCPTSAPRAQNSCQSISRGRGKIATERLN